MTISMSVAAFGRYGAVASLSLLLAGAVAPTSQARTRPSTHPGPPPTVAEKQEGSAGGWRGWADAGEPPLRGTALGINAGGLMFEGSDATVAGRLRSTAGMGARVLRFDASWSGVEPLGPIGGRDPVRRFGSLDRQVLGAARAGLRPLLVVGYGTPWATSDGGVFTTPSDPATFARFASAVAARYASSSAIWRDNGVAAPAGGVLYEIWNEPNAEFFLRDQQTAPQRYATLLLLAQRAIRSADPGARITVGGLVPVGAARFLAGVLRAEPALRREVDAIGWHPYERTAAAVVRITRQFRRTLDALGLASVPLDITEIGWSEEEIPEPRRSRELERALTGLQAPGLGVGLLVPFVALDRAGPGSYGLWRTTGEATESVDAFARVARRAAGRRR